MEVKSAKEQEILEYHGIPISRPQTAPNAGSDKPTLVDILQNQGINPEHGIGEHIQNYEDDKQFWSQFRGDYIDLRDFIKKETLQEKKDWIKTIAKARVILIREHILTIWTFNPDQREQLLPQLEAINLIIYSGKDELEANEQYIKDQIEKMRQEETSDEDITTDENITLEDVGEEPNEEEGNRP